MNKQSKAAENERSKRLEATWTLKASEEDLAKAKAALTEAIRERDSALAGLADAQKQAEDQTKRLLEAEDQLRIAKELISDLNKRLILAKNAKGVAEYARDKAMRAKQEAEFARNEAKAAKETAKDEGYNAGVADTQASLKAQTPRVCRLYCSQVWEEALKRAGVDVSFDLWKAENIFYPIAICKATSTSSEAVSDQHEGEVTHPEAVQVGASPGEPLKGGELQDVIEASKRMDPELPKEVTEPMVGAQVPNAKEPTIPAQPLQAIPLAVVPKSTNTDPAQSSPEGTVL